MNAFFYSVFIVLILSFASTGAATDKQHIKNLPGYSETNLVSGFTEFLQKNPAAFKKLENNSQLSQQIFRTPSLQRAMMQTAATQNNAVNHTAPNNNGSNANISDEARYEIERMRKTYQRTKEDPEFAKYAASAENEGAQQQQSTAETPTESADASDDTAAFDNAPFSIANVNAIPTVDGLEPDANGWPKYLNAPAHCKPPSPELSYFYEFRFKHGAGRPMLPSTAGRLSANDNDTVIANYFYPYSLGLGDTRDIYLKANESLAIPFVASGHINIFHSAYRSAAMDRIISLSDCPGDVSGPSGGNNFGKNCIGHNSHDRSQLSTTTNPILNSNACRIELGKRYFLNIQPTRHIERIVDNTPIYAQVPSDCINKPCKIGAFSIRGANRLFKPVPYNGPCLQQGPFPLNYNSTTCGRSFNGRTCARSGSVTIECADPQNELGTVRLVQGCQAGANPIWLEGYGKPIHSRLQCSVTHIENAPTANKERHFFLEGYLDYPEIANQTGSSLQVGPYAPPSSAPSNAYGHSTNTVESTDEAQAKPSQYTFGSDNTNDIRIGGGKDSRIPEAANITSSGAAIAKEGANVTTNSGTTIRDGIGNIGRNIGNNIREDFRNIGNGLRDTGTNLRNLLSSSSGTGGSSGNNNAPIFSGGFEGGSSSGDSSSDTPIFSGDFEDGGNTSSGGESSLPGNSSGGGSSSGSRGAEMQRQINMQREIDSAMREAEMLKNWQTKGGAQQQR